MSNQPYRTGTRNARIIDTYNEAEINTFAAETHSIYARQHLVLTPDDLEALRQGKYIVLCDHEYTTVIYVEPTEADH